MTGKYAIDAFSLINSLSGIKDGRVIPIREVLLVLAELNYLYGKVREKEYRVSGIKHASVVVGVPDKKELATFIILLNVYSKSAVTLKNKIAICISALEGKSFKNSDGYVLSAAKLVTGFSETGKKILRNFDSGALKTICNRRDLAEHRENTEAIQLLEKIGAFSDLKLQRECTELIEFELDLLNKAHEQISGIFDEIMQLPFDEGLRFGS